MTPEEILRDLRDIHLPDQGADAAGTGIVWWPVLLVVILVLLSLALAWRRRSAWRREIARHLDAIEKDADRGRTREAWTALAVLLRRIAMTVEGRQDVAGLIGEPWLAKARPAVRDRRFLPWPRPRRHRLSLWRQAR